MSLIVIAENNNQELNPVTLTPVSAAAVVGGAVDILDAGSGRQAFDASPTTECRDSRV